MKTKHFLLIVLCGLITIVFNGCEKSNNPITPRIIYGNSTGFPIGVHQIKLNESLFSYERVGGAPDANKRCSKAADDGLFKEILNTADLHSFRQLPKVIGCPDCTDGGAEYLEIEMDGIVHRVSYNPGEAPKEIAEVVAKLKSVMVSFNDCQP